MRVCFDQHCNAALPGGTRQSIVAAAPFLERDCPSRSDKSKRQKHSRRAALKRINAGSCADRRSRASAATALPARVAVEEEDVRLHSLRVEDARGQDSRMPNVKNGYAIASTMRESIVRGLFLRTRRRPTLSRALGVCGRTRRSCRASRSNGTLPEQPRRLHARPRARPGPSRYCPFVWDF